MSEFNEDELKKLEDIFDRSIVEVPSGSEDTLGKDLQEIVKELRHPDNIARFGNQEKEKIGNMSLLDAIADVPNYPVGVKARYSFIRSFQKSYDIRRSAIKSEQVERFTKIVSSLLGFRGLLEYRSAGVRDSDLGLLGQDKHNLLDKVIKK